MQRILLTLGGGLLTGISMTLIGGFSAAMILSRMSVHHDGGPEMAGMFQIGPLIGFLSMIVSGAVIWWLAGVPGRVPWILTVVGALAATAAIGVAVMMAPRPTPPNPNFVGVTGSLRMEVKLRPSPSSAPAVLRTLSYDLRQGGETLVGEVFPKEARIEDGLTVLPGAFSLHGLEGFIIFGIMNDSHQVDVVSLDLPGRPDPTDWSAWKTMDGGWQVRWRVIRTDKRGATAP